MSKTPTPVLPSVSLDSLMSDMEARGASAAFPRKQNTFPKPSDMSRICSECRHGEQSHLNRFIQDDRIEAEKKRIQEHINSLKRGNHDWSVSQCIHTEERKMKQLIQQYTPIVNRKIQELYNANQIITCATRALGLVHDL